MKIFRTYKVVGILLALVIVLTVCLFYFVPDFGKGDLYMGLVTFSVGLFAIGLYIKQKEDFKRDTAAALLMELRFAEKGIDDLTRTNPNFDPWITLLPTSSWDTYGHIFTDVLDADELDLINSFYVNCRIIEKAASLLDPTSQTENKMASIQTTLVQLAKECADVKSYEVEKQKLLSIAHDESYTFRANAPAQRVTAAILSANKVTTSTAGEKLKKIAGQNKGY